MNWIFLKTRIAGESNLQRRGRGRGDSKLEVLVEVNSLIESSITFRDDTKIINLFKEIKKYLKIKIINEKLLKSKQTTINSFFKAV